MIEAKEEIHRFRIDTERELKDRRSEVQRMERRLQQKEENLDRKIESLERKEEVIAKRESDLERKQDQLNQLYDKQVAELNGCRLTQGRSQVLLPASVETETAMKWYPN